MKEAENIHYSPFFSIIIPVYNVSKYIEDCVNSILDQSFKDFEIILVNDGSTDGSGGICDKYVINNKHVKVIHKSNSGTASARNAGLKIAEGEYVWFVDSDDIIVEKSLSILYGLLQLSRNILVLNFRKLDFKDGEYYDKSIRFPQNTDEIITITEDSIKHMPSSVCYSLFNKKFILDLGIVFNENNQYEDEYFNLQLYANYKFKILSVEFPFYLYRRRTENSKSSSNHSDSCFLKSTSQIELFKYASNIITNSFNSDLLLYKKRVYAENALVFYENYLISDFPKKQSLLKKIFKDNITHFSINGKLFKSSQLKRILYNLQINFFIGYVKLVQFYKSNLIFLTIYHKKGNRNKAVK